MNWVADWMTTCITMFLQHHPPWKCLLYTLQRTSSLKRQKPSIFWALRRIPETDNCNTQNSQMLHPMVERTFRYLKIIYIRIHKHQKTVEIKTLQGLTFCSCLRTMSINIFSSGILGISTHSCFHVKYGSEFQRSKL